MKLIDKNVKSNPAILDNFMVVPVAMTGKQKAALARLRVLHKRKFTEVPDANPA